MKNLFDSQILLFSTLKCICKSYWWDSPLSIRDSPIQSQLLLTSSALSHSICCVTKESTSPHKKRDRVCVTLIHLFFHYQPTLLLTDCCYLPLKCWNILTTTIAACHHCESASILHLVKWSSACNALAVDVCSLYSLISVTSYFLSGAQQGAALLH